MLAMLTVFDLGAQSSKEAGSIHRMSLLESLTGSLLAAGFAGRFVEQQPTELALRQPQQEHDSKPEQ